MWLVDVKCLTEMQVILSFFACNGTWGTLCNTVEKFYAREMWFVCLWGFWVCFLFVYFNATAESATVELQKPFMSLRLATQNSALLFKGKTFQ